LYCSCCVQHLSQQPLSCLRAKFLVFHLVLLSYSCVSSGHPVDEIIPYSGDFSTQVGSPIEKRSGGQDEKRGTLLLDKIMVAVKDAVRSKNNTNQFSSTAPMLGDMATFTQAGDRRSGSNKVYWRCYFNAVACF
jgi:hypothetical protein